MTLRVELRTRAGTLEHVARPTTAEGLRRVLEGAARKGLRPTVTSASGAERVGEQ
jgi:hypothetical protein